MRTQQTPLIEQRQCNNGDYKILNLFSGIGGNAMYWKDENVTAVEINPSIAREYKKNNPGHKVVVADALSYIQKNYESEWDFIWASPPCQSHSQIRGFAAVGTGQVKPIIPDMNSLYGLICFLRTMSLSSGVDFNGVWVVENVRPYYDPLIPPTASLSRHLFWSNIEIPERKFKKYPIREMNSYKDVKRHFGIDISRCNVPDKRSVSRSCVNPEIGKYILELAKKEHAEVKQ